MLYFPIHNMEKLIRLGFMSQSLPSNDDAAALLAWYVAMGVDEAHTQDPVDRFSYEPEPQKTASQLGDNPQKIQIKSTDNNPKTPPKPIAAMAASSADFDAALKSAHELANNCKTLSELKTALENFDGCSLKQTATHTVFSDGIEGAPLMVISAASGADEDRTGIAFQGISGQLLDKMIAAIGYSRETNAYLTHIVPWRPLGNRNPDGPSLDLCRPFMMKHIELAKPKAILLLGNAAAKCISTNEEIIARMRGKWLTLPVNGLEIAAMPTYHPDYLLKHPRYKKDSWQDLLALKEVLKA